MDIQKSGHALVIEQILNTVVILHAYDYSLLHWKALTAIWQRAAISDLKHTCILYLGFILQSVYIVELQKSISVHMCSESVCTCILCNLWTHIKLFKTDLHYKKGIHFGNRDIDIGVMSNFTILGLIHVGSLSQLPVVDIEAPHSASSSNSGLKAGAMTYWPRWACAIAQHPSTSILGVLNYFSSRIWGFNTCLFIHFPPFPPGSSWWHQWFSAAYYKFQITLG